MDDNIADRGGRSLSVLDDSSGRAPDIDNRIKKVGAAAAVCTNLDDIAACAGVTPAEVEACMAEYPDEVERAAKHAKFNGQAAVLVANATVLAGAEYIHGAIKRGDLDPTEVADLMKPALRLLDLEQRREAARKDADPLAGLPRVEISIHYGSISIKPLPVTDPAPDNVIEMEGPAE